MTTTITKHKRGIFGRFWQICFWLFQALMIWLVFINLSSGSEVGAACEGDGACQAGVALGSGLVATVGWMVWLLGTVILGILMMATRGKLVTKSV